MIEKEESSLNLLIDGLFNMGLPKENIIAVATMLTSEKKKVAMLDWIKRHHKENPHKLTVMLVAIRLKNGINAEITDSLIQGVRLISKSLDLMAEVVMTMTSEKQMQTMIEWIYKHQKENPNEDRVIRIAKKISEQIA